MGVHGPVHRGAAGAQPRRVQVCPPRGDVVGELPAGLPRGAVEDHAPRRGCGVAQPRDDDGAGRPRRVLGRGQLSGLVRRAPQGGVRADAHAGDHPGQMGGGGGVSGAHGGGGPTAALEVVGQQLARRQGTVHGVRGERVGEALQRGAAPRVEPVLPAQVLPQPFPAGGALRGRERQRRQACGGFHARIRRERAVPAGRARTAAPRRAAPDGVPGSAAPDAGATPSGRPAPERRSA